MSSHHTNDENLGDEDVREDGFREERGREDSAREPRYDLSGEAASLRTPMCSPAKVVVRNLSRHGFQTEWPYTLKRGDRVWLKIKGVESLRASVAWFDRYTIGCRFEHPLHDAVLVDILAKAGGRRKN